LGKAARDGGVPNTKACFNRDYHSGALITDENRNNLWIKKVFSGTTILGS